MSTQQPLNNINVFADLQAFEAHTTPTIGDDELTLVGGVSVVVESYVNGTSWYRIWSDGWIEQGGYNDDNNAAVIINFVTPFSTECYGVVQCSGNTGRVEGNPYITAIGLTSFTFGGNGKGYWRAYGK